MFKVSLVIVPPGGGEADYSLEMDMPALPREGDYISVLRSGKVSEDSDYTGSEDFIVRRVWWTCDFPDDGKMSNNDGEGPVGNVTQIGVECEYAVGHYSSKAHKRNAGEKAEHFQASAY